MRKSDVVGAIAVVGAFASGGVGVWAKIVGREFTPFDLVTIEPYHFWIAAGVLLVGGLLLLARPLFANPNRVAPMAAAQHAFENNLLQARQAAALAAAQSVQLNPPAVVNVAEIGDMLRHGARAVVSINGQVVGEITGNNVVSAHTTLGQNVIGVMHTGTGAVVSAPFTAHAGEVVTLVVVPAKSGALLIDQR
ncbi:MAG: hypothetical protein LBD97_03450 [Bifidobacteriaceae bacterium]|jgi:hypothetical protein|nr:hypothetical protein [Bifidobacteriaceae bacterium]